METQHNPVVISKDSRNQQLSSKLSYPVNYLHSLEEVKVSLHNSVWSAERELASTVCELRTSRCSSWIYKRQRNQRSNCQHPLVRKEQDNSRKTSTSALLTMPKPLTVWITTNYGKFFKRWEYQNTWPVFWEIWMQVKKQQLEPDMEQWTGSKLGKEYFKAVYCHSLLI